MHKTRRKKTIPSVLLFITLCFFISSCKKTTAALETAPSPIASNNEVTQSTIKPTAVPIGNSPTPATTYLDKALSYRSYQPTDEILVFISEDSKNQQVVISNNSISWVFFWEYNLAYGEPIVKVDRNDSTDALYIILPTVDLKPILNVEEISGVAHILNPTTLEEYPFKDEIDLHKNWTSIDYTASLDDSNSFKNAAETFTFHISPNWDIKYYYPGIKLPTNETYEIVFEDTAHYTNSLLVYRQVGFKQGNETIWIGKFCDDITKTNIVNADNLSDRAMFNFIFLPYKDILYTKEDGLTLGNTWTREERMLNGEMLTLDPDDALDLNSDGTKEILSYRGLPNSTRFDYYESCTLTVNDSTIEYDGDNINSTIYAGSLDGKTLQLMIFDNGPSSDPILQVYQYVDNKLKYSGEVLSYHYTLNKDGFTAYCESYHIQCFRVPFQFKFENGTIKKIEQDFYPQGNTVTVLKDFTLYEDKNEDTLGITLTTGNEVIIVGSDLTEWVYIKDITSGKSGWLKTMNGENNCLLPDGRAVPAVELFEGLTFYG